jgi:hypothetical protein
VHQRAERRKTNNKNTTISKRCEPKRNPRNDFCSKFRADSESGHRSRCTEIENVDRSCYSETSPGNASRRASHPHINLPAPLPPRPHHPRSQHSVHFPCNAPKNKTDTQKEEHHAEIEGANTLASATENLRDLGRASTHTAKTRSRM